MRIGASTPDERRVAQFMRVFLDEHGIGSLIIAQGNRDISLRASNRIDARLGSEGYRLAVGKRGVAIEARTGAGLFYGVQTLTQITRSNAQQQISTPTGTILDWPAYPWRGLHLDVSRHFFSVAAVKRFIDLAAHYKFNTFHWHLTDDQAWRLEIAKYPLLTRGGEYYTQAQIKEVVSYARERFVRIVPEIEMPGHSSAAIRAYPGLACSSASRTSGVVCPQPQTVTFFENVLTEAMQLFPGPFVHLGGDEVAYTADRSLMMRQLAEFLRVRGRSVVVWDDARAAHIPSAMLMVWHAGLAPGALVGSSGAVMSPDGPLYFNAYQGEPSGEPPAAQHLSTLEEVYDYNPASQPRTSAQRVRVFGVQGNVWTEKISTPQQLFYMELPRVLALAEIAWTPASLKNWDTFERRLPAQLQWLDRHGYPYRVPNAWISVHGGHLAFSSIPGRVQSVALKADARQVQLELGVPMQNAQIYYTLDGSLPSQASPLYGQPFTLQLNRNARVYVRVIAFLPGGRHSAVSECIITWRAHVQSSRSTWRSFVSP
ncbi:MAG: hypothetical protein NVSMB31_02660 [Vulcanimicrobiaceae bacterium]